MSGSHSDSIAIDMEVSSVVKGNIEAAARSCALVLITETDGVWIVEEEVGGCLSEEKQGGDKDR